VGSRDSNLEWIQSILSAEAEQIFHFGKRKDPALWPGLFVWGNTALPVVMVVVTMMMTGLGRRYCACKHCQCNNGEHQIANLHGESSSSRVTLSDPALRLAYPSEPRPT
jgi:hypothetical protein